MESVGLRELRQDASGLVRRVELGEEILVTVAGRPSARLVPVRLTRWHRWADVQDLFTGVGDPDWTTDRELVGDSLRDPWEAR